MRADRVPNRKKNEYLSNALKGPIPPRKKAGPFGWTET